MPAKLRNLISLYDCIGWIPTIRGCLSLDLIDEAKSILGDVDKYSVRFKTTEGFHSQHYLIASSLVTVNDSKAGKDIDRTYRYVFTGSINDNETTQSFLADNQLTGDAPLNDYIKKEGLLLGHLFMVYEDDLTDLEANFLKELQRINDVNKNYLDAFHVKAQSMEVLKGYRTDLLNKWRHLRGIAQRLEKDDKNKRHTFCFDIALTRDGILLLKDVTKEDDRSYFAAPGTADDYRQNIAVHRLFKIAMNCVKYLFHSNYHHNEDHDTYLPASNLHPAREFGTLDFQRIFKHQLDAFLVPVIKLKRSTFSNHTIESYGVLLYAKSFVKVFEVNELISCEEAEKSKEYIEILESEVTEMTAPQRTLFNTLITQHNPFIIASALLAFVFTCLELISFFVCIPKAIKIEGFLQFQVLDGAVLKNIVFAVILLAVTGYTLYIIPRSRILARQFKPKKKAKNWLFKNSCLKKKRFSLLYKLYIFKNTVKLQIRERGQVVIRMIFYLFCLLVALYCMIKFVF